jgi:hypothetical protein
MTRLRLAPRADLGVCYDADAVRYERIGSDVLRHVTRDFVIARYSDCPSIGFEYDGQPIGGIVFDGEQAHIAVLPAWHGRWAILLKPALDWLFSLKAEILVNVETDNAVCLEFMRRNAWPVVATNGHEILHRMTRQDRRRPRGAHCADPPTC